MTDRADLRAVTADLLASLGRVTGDPRFSHAAGILRGGKAGRPELDDAAALGLARRLIAEGAAKSRRNACEIAATFYADHAETNAMIGRLQRKLSHK